VRAAWSRAVERGRWDLVGRSEQAMARFAFVEFQETDLAPLLAFAERRLRETLRVPERRTGEALRVLGQLIITQTAGFRLKSRTPTAQGLRESLDLLDEAEQLGEEVRIHRCRALGRIATCLSPARAEEAIAYCTDAVELARRIGDRAQLAGSLMTKAWALLLNWRLEEARPLFEETLELRRELGSTSRIVKSYVDLVILATLQDRLDEAARLTEEAARLFRAAPREGLTQFGRFQWPWLFLVQGRFDEAQPIFEERVATFRERSALPALAHALDFVVQNEYLSGRYQQARAHAEEALQLARDIGYALRVGECCFNLGCIALGERNLAEAEHWLEQLRLHPVKPVDKWHLPCLLAGPVAALAGRVEEARAQTARALALRGHGALPRAALYYALRGDAERAIEVHTRMSSHPLIANSPWFEDVIGVHVTAAAAELSPHVVSAAQERGRSTHPRAMVDEIIAELEG
jgi:tetratricopeptide (TPR) repeat protein